MLKDLYLKIVKIIRCVIVNFCVKFDMFSVIFGQSVLCVLYFDKVEYNNKIKYIF